MLRKVVIILAGIILIQGSVYGQKEWEGGNNLPVLRLIELYEKVKTFELLFDEMEVLHRHINRMNMRIKADLELNLGKVENEGDVEYLRYLNDMLKRTNVYEYNIKMIIDNNNIDINDKKITYRSIVKKPYSEYFKINMDFYGFLKFSEMDMVLKESEMYVLRKFGESMRGYFLEDMLYEKVFNIKYEEIKEISQQIKVLLEDDMEGYFTVMGNIVDLSRSAGVYMLYFEEIMKKLEIVDDIVNIFEENVDKGEELDEN